MIDSMLMGKPRTIGAVKDGNVDATMIAIDKLVAEGNSRSAGVNLNITSSATAAIGYWQGQLQIIGEYGVQAWDANTLASIGWVRNDSTGAAIAGQTIPLNTSCYLYRQFLFFGLGRAAGNGVIKRYDMAQKVYYTYPTAPVLTGVLYADKDYLYIFAGVASTGLANSRYFRFAHGGTAWETVIIGAGSFTHGVAGGEATMIDGKVYIHGGGSRNFSNDSADGGSYTVIEYIDIAANTVGRVTVDSPGILVNGTTGTDQGTCLWGKYLYYAGTGNVVTVYPLDGSAKSTMSGQTTGYHCPCMRVGNMFYYMQGYNSLNLNRIKIPGGL